MGLPPVRDTREQDVIGLQELLRPGELATLGKHLETALKDSTQTCILRTEATKLRPGK